MKIHVNFDNFESKQNGTCDIEIDADDILKLIADLNEKAARAHEAAMKAADEALKAETFKQKTPGKA